MRFASSMEHHLKSVCSSLIITLTVSGTNVTLSLIFSGQPSPNLADDSLPGCLALLDLPGDVAPKIVQCSIQEQNLSPIPELCQYDT